MILNLDNGNHIIFFYIFGIKADKKNAFLIILLKNILKEILR